MASKSHVQGVVASDKMDKTVVVVVERKVRHGVYGKIQRRSSRFMAHDESNQARVGDLVEIVESRPLSRHKRWVVTQVLQRAGERMAGESLDEKQGAEGQV
jgi:small subunit ribosomal protein S17